jgi:Rps23 Pro-64 3,4-dihydroxylase Tpa1-like proline 4-hydroxylase
MMITEDPNEVQRRLQEFYTVSDQTWSSMDELGPGIFVYHDVIPTNSITRLEEVLNNERNPYQYSEAMVGYGMKMPEYRDCFDFKFKKTDIESDRSSASIELQDIWQSVYDQSIQPVKHYANHFRTGELRYWEAMNFIKYGPGQHFQEHHDHGYSYNCVVSLVGYPNDDYEGGELYFRLQNLTVKPRAGDLFVFPSNFMYPHRAMPVKSGFKHSIVTMLDYSEKFHRPEFYQETNS